MRVKEATYFTDACDDATSFSMLVEFFVLIWSLRPRVMVFSFCDTISHHDTKVRLVMALSGSSEGETAVCLETKAPVL